MATIFCSMSGEGRGHATRMRSIAERLKDRHRIVLFAPADAFRFLDQIYGSESPNSGGPIEVVEIPGLTFHYVNRRLNLTQTILAGFQYLRTTLGDVTTQLSRRIEDEKPDLIISDFEPALPRAALRCGLPFISMTHQHFLTTYDLSILPWRLKWHAWSMTWAVWAHYTGQSLTMVSSFFTPKLREGFGDVVQLGPMIRPEIRNANVITGDHFVSYLRKNTPESKIELLRNSGLRIKIYGVGQRAAYENITFHEIDPNTFVEDLATCRGVISAAGNQLLGESLYLGKPVFAMPEANHHEQLINSHFLAHMGCGNWVTLETLEARHLHEFVEHCDDYRERIAEICENIDGTDKAVSVIEECLAKLSPQKTHPVEGLTASVA